MFRAREEQGWEPLWLDVQGWRLFARCSKGSPPGAPVVILVHGLVISSRYMVPLLKRLGGSFRVYAPDFPGYGRSPKVSEALEPLELADVLAAWMDVAGIPEAALVGNSYGCNIIAEFGVRHPQRLTKAVLQGPTAEASGRSLGRQVSRLMRNSLVESSGLGLIMARDYLRAGMRTIRGTVDYALTHPIEKALPRLGSPALVVRGSRDPIVPQEWAEHLSALLPQGQLKIIPGGAHTLNYSAPLELARVITPFLTH